MFETNQNEGSKTQSETVFQTYRTSIRESTKRAVKEQSGREEQILGSPNNPIRFADLDNPVEFGQISLDDIEEVLQFFEKC